MSAQLKVPFSAPYLILQVLHEKCSVQLLLPEAGTELSTREAWEMAHTRLRLDDQEITEMLSAASGVPVARNLNEVDDKVLDLLPFRFVQTLNVLLLKLDEHDLIIVVRTGLNGPGSALRIRGVPTVW